MQALVDAVRLRRRVFHAGDQDRRRRERGGEFGDERDGPAHPHFDRLGAPGLSERRPGGVIDRAAGVDGIGLTDVAGRHRHVCSPRSVLFQMGAQRVQVRGRVTARGHPHADLGAGARDQRIRRCGNGCGVDADHGDRRLGP